MKPELGLRPDLFARLAIVAEALGDTGVAADACDLALQEERGELNVLVVGQVKRGKSTLVNALLNEDLMPTGALPVTGLVTALRYGQKRSIQVQFRDGYAIVIAPDQLADYVSESGNPKNSRAVERVEITWPAPALRGLVLFDTPGIGSIWEHNSETAREALPRADAAILVLGPDPPIGSLEIAFVRDVVGSSERLFVVVNKADTTSALDAVVGFTEETLARVIGRPLDMNVLSATAVRDAQRLGHTNAAFGVFLSHLRAFVEDHGAETRVRSIRRRGRALLGRLDLVLGMKRQALSLSTSQRRDAREAVGRAVQLLDDRVRTFELTIDDDVRNLRLRLEEELIQMKQRDQAAFRSHASALARESDGARRVATFQAILSERADCWRGELVARIHDALAIAERRYMRTLSEIEAAAVAAGCRALAIESIQELPARTVTIPRPRIDYIPSLAPQTGLELLIELSMAVLPVPLQIRLRENRLATNLVQELDALTGKMRYGIAGDLETWRQATRRAVASSLGATRDMVLHVFDDEPATDKPENAARLAQQTEELASLRRELASET